MYFLVPHFESIDDVFLDVSLIVFTSALIGSKVYLFEHFLQFSRDSKAD